MRGALTMFANSLAVLALSAFCGVSTVAGSGIHRRASPQTIYLAARQIPQGSLTRRSLSPINVPLTEFFDGTDLQWYGDIEVGTPPQKLTVVFDTGSSTLEFASTLCGAACANQVQYDPSKSSTFVDGLDADIPLIFGTGVGVEPVIGDNTELQLRSARDTVAVGGVSVPHLPFFMITNQTPTFAIDPFSGIQGMSSIADGLFAGLEAQGLPSLFSLYLTPHNIGNAELILGGINTTRINGNLTYAPLTKNSTGSWLAESSAITVNGKSTPALIKDRIFLFDSGTSNLVLPLADTEAIYAQISPDIKPFSDEPGTYGIPCSQINYTAAEITFTLASDTGSQFNLTVPSSELSVGPFKSNSSICQTLINAQDGLFIVGASLFKHYYTVWDLGNQRIGFSPTIAPMAHADTNASAPMNSPQIWLLALVHGIVFLALYGL